MTVHYQDGTNLRDIKGIYYQDGTNLRTIKEAWYQDGTNLRKIFPNHLYMATRTQLIRVNIDNLSDTTGIYGVVGNFHSAVSSRCLTAHDGYMYTADIQSGFPPQDDVLWRINHDNPTDAAGVYGSIGYLSSDANRIATGLASQDGVLYVANYDGVAQYTDDLYKIEASGAFTSFTLSSVGRFPSGLNVVGGLTSHKGFLYAASGGNLWRINATNPSDTTGVYGDLGSAGATLQGLTSFGDHLYGITSNAFLYRINTDDPDDSTGDYGRLSRVANIQSNAVGLAVF